MSFKVETEFPIAFDSADHLHPWGTKRDNNTNENFVQEIISRFMSNNRLKVIDLGCSGGKLVRSWLNHTEYAVGLEGSDYSAKAARAEWPELYNKNLFTCDVSRPYQIMYNDEPFKANLINAWELVDHIEPTRVDEFVKMIDRHLMIDGVFVGSGAIGSDAPDGVELHVNRQEKSFWDEKFEAMYYKDRDYPFSHVVRGGCDYNFCYTKVDPNKLTALF